MNRTPEPPPKRIGRAIGCAGLMLAACSSETVTRPPPAPVAWASLEAQPAADEKPEVLTSKERLLPDAYCNAVASTGLSALGPLLDDDAHFAFPGMKDAHGRDEVVHAHDVLLGAFDDRKMAPDRVWRTPVEQTVEWTFTGVQTHDWMGVPSTRKTVAFKGVTLLFTTDDGRIADVRVYFDAAVVKAQLGAGPKDLQVLPPPSPPAGPAEIFDQTQPGSGGVDVVKATLDALESENESAYVGALTDDVQVFTPERASPARGKEEAKQYYLSMHRAIGQLDTAVDDAWDVGRFAVVAYSIAGEQMGPIDGIALQPDKVVRLDLVDVCEIRDRKIARIWRYDNPLQILGETE